ncbi:hypothetical protein PAHAL_1G302000 [Panicum hallii]|uniref:Uncharacterized protein n=1 Tax=Panicum hallii TaxID=206008 RepID=A0A2T8KWT5_9POAL|nr:hypothetical protein PAHAL_1G302000 [Panicum hallii]
MTRFLFAIGIETLLLADNPAMLFDGPSQQPCISIYSSTVNSIAWILAPIISEVSYLKKPLQYVLSIDLCHRSVVLKPQCTKMTSFF